MDTGCQALADAPALVAALLDADCELTGVLEQRGRRRPARRRGPRQPGTTTPPPSSPRTRRGADMTILVVVRATDRTAGRGAARGARPHPARRARRGRARRAAGDPLAAAAVDTLRSFGHPVEPLAGDALTAALSRAARVEVWT